MTSLVIHHLENSRSHRIVWLLEEMGLAYDLIFHRRLPDMSAPPALLGHHALGKAPILVDDDRSYAESGAIIEHLLDRPEGGKFRPAVGTDALERYRYWLHFAEGSMMPPLLVKLYLSRLPQVPAEVSGRIDGQLSGLLGFCDRTLADSDWFAGEAFSGADIQMSYPLEAAMSRAGLDGRFPNLLGFIDRIRKRPAYLAAREREGLAERAG